MDLARLALRITGVLLLLDFVLSALPWPTAARLMSSFGIEAPWVHPTMVYLFRLALFSYGLIGVFFLVLARRLEAHTELLAPLGILSLMLGVVLLAAGMRYGLPVWAYALDFLYCAALGVVLLRARGGSSGATVGAG